MELFGVLTVYIMLVTEPTTDYLDVQSLPLNTIQVESLYFYEPSQHENIGSG